jgi:polar amino acid transport system permease protein
VLLPLARPRRGGGFALRPIHGLVVFAALFIACGIAEAEAAPGEPGIIATILKWTPLLARGFALNIAISFLAMAIGTVAGFLLGIGQISLAAPVR